MGTSKGNYTENITLLGFSFISIKVIKLIQEQKLFLMRFSHHYGVINRCENPPEFFHTKHRGGSNGVFIVNNSLFNSDLLLFLQLSCFFFYFLSQNPTKSRHFTCLSNLFNSYSWPINSKSQFFFSRISPENYFN